MFNHILVPIDESDGSRTAVDAAVGWSRRHGARMRLMHHIDVLAFPNVHGYGQPVIESARQYAEALVRQECLRVEASGVVAEARVALSPGTRLGESVAIEAREWPADLVIVGSHGRKGLTRALLGSGAEQILRHCPVPALLVRPSPPGAGLSRILVALDGSDTSMAALAAAVQLGRDRGAQLRLVHSVGDMAYLGAYGYADNYLQEVREEAAQMLARGEQLAKAAGVAVQSLVGAGEQGLGDFIAEQAREWEADLVVVGSHGRRGIERLLLGSGAEQIIRQSPASVLVIPAAVTRPGS